MVLIVQFVGVGFGLFMLYLFFLHYKRNDITRIEFLVWFLVWFGFILISFFPYSLDFFVEALDFKRTLDFFVFLGVFFIVFMTLFLYLKMRANSTKLERLVRRVAIRNAKKN